MSKGDGNYQSTVSSADKPAPTTDDSAFSDRGREELSTSPPPNRACNLPAHGSPVSGCEVIFYNEDVEFAHVVSVVVLGVHILALPVDAIFRRRIWAN